jgi:hypothetical protein
MSKLVFGDGVEVDIEGPILLGPAIERQTIWIPLQKALVGSWIGKDNRSGLPWPQGRKDFLPHAKIRKIHVLSFDRLGHGERNASSGLFGDNLMAFLFLNSL